MRVEFYVGVNRNDIKMIEHPIIMTENYVKAYNPNFEPHYKWFRIVANIPDEPEVVGLVEEIK